MEANGFLHAVDDSSGEIVNSMFANDCLNRYSFLFKVDADEQRNQESAIVSRSNALIVKLLEAIAQQIASSATWVSAWNDHSGDLYTPIRAKAETSRRRKQGYSIYEELGAVNKPQLSLGIKPKLSLALKPADTFRSQEGKPFDFFRVFRGQFLVFGKMPPLELFISSKAYATMNALAKRSKLTPSENFLAWFEEQSLSLLYEDIDERGYFVLIVVVPRKLDVEQLLHDQIVDKVID